MDKSIFDNFIARTDGGTDYLGRFMAAVRGGDNTILHNRLTQSVTLDENWITTIEGALYSIELIVRNPRKFIVENELVVDVALAKRTNSKTVRHLASHSQYIQNIDDRGDVTPKKLLTAELDEDLAIYENRFICALVNRLILFVEQRYHDLSSKIEVFTQTNVKLHSSFKMGENKFNCDINLSVDEPPEDTSFLEANKALFERIDVIRRRLRVLQATDFIRSLAKVKPVRPPIQKTNLLRKNVDYNNAYKLWLYISSYTYLGYSVEVQDKTLPVEGDYYDDLSILAALSLRTLMDDNVLRKDKYDAIEYDEPQEKEYAVVSNFEYKPEFKNTTAQPGEEVINEYYYRRMRDELYRAAQDGEFEVENSLNVDFVRFFRSIARINDAMFTELIEDQIEKRTSNMEINDAVDKKKQKYRQARDRLQRTKLFLKLKWEELERAQRLVERMQNQLDKSRTELNVAQTKARARKTVRRKAAKKK